MLSEINLLGIKSIVSPQSKEETIQKKAKKRRRKKEEKRNNLEEVLPIVAV